MKTVALSGGDDFTAHRWVNGVRHLGEIELDPGKLLVITHAHLAKAEALQIGLETTDLR